MVVSFFWLSSDVILLLIIIELYPLFIHIWNFLKLFPPTDVQKPMHNALEVTTFIYDEFGRFYYVVKTIVFFSTLMVNNNVQIFL